MGLQLNIYNFPVFLAALLNAGLIVFVLASRRKTPIHRAFIGWNAALTIWNLGAAGIYGALSAPQAMLWSRFCYHGIVFIPATFLYLVLTLCDHVDPWQYALVRAEAVLGALLLAANYWHPGFLDGNVTARFWGYGPVGGPGTRILDPLLGGTSLYALFLLRRQLHQTQGVRHNQLLYIYWGTVIAFVGGGINVLVIHGMNIYPFGNIINIVYSLSVAYAIVSYSWMDIRVVISRGIVYGVMGSALACAYLSAIYFLEKTLQLHEQRWLPELRLVILSSTFFFWPWLKIRIRNALDNYLWPGASVYRRQLRDLGSMLSSCLDIEKIASAAVQQIPALLGSAGGAFFLLDSTANQWRLVAAAGSVHPARDIELDQLRPSWFQGSCEQEVVTDELDWRLKTDPLIPAQGFALRDWLKEHGAMVSVPVRFQKRLMGLWILGDSANGRSAPLSARTILRDLAGQMALGAQNAMTVLKIEKEQSKLAKDREIAAIGTVVTEMAHELTKPLTNIMNEGNRLHNAVNGTSKNSLSKIEKEVQRAAEILDGFALLSPDRTLHKIPMLLQELLDEAVTALGLEEDVSVKLERNYGKFPPINVNPGQIVQIFTNVIQNAWQAMRDGGTLTLSLSLLNDESTVMIAIEDTGPGIPPDLREKLFDAFVTTKRAQGGRGVGLTISKAMVERHGGQIEIESPIRAEGGTRVRIMLPIKKGAALV